MLIYFFFLILISTIYFYNDKFGDAAFSQSLDLDFCIHIEGIIYRVTIKLM